MDKSINIRGESGNVTINIFMKGSDMENGSRELERTETTHGRTNETEYILTDRAPVSSGPIRSKEQSDCDDNGRKRLKKLYKGHLNDPKVFQMVTKPKGMVYIFNNHTFSHPELEDRTGSDKDCKHLSATFSHISNCDIHFRSDLSAEDMEDQLRLIAKSPRNASFYAIFIMSHGRLENGKDLVLGADGNPIDSQMIVNLFNVPDLHQIPTLIFFQACRGNKMGDAGLKSPQSFGTKSCGDQPDGDPFYGNDENDADDYLDQEVLALLRAALPRGKVIGLTDDETADVSCTDVPDASGEDYVNAHPNVMVSFSADEGHLSLRNVNKGSWFIQEICTQFNSKADTKDLISIMKDIHDELYSKDSDDPDFRKKYPNYRAAARTAHTLEKKLYFFPGL